MLLFTSLFFLTTYGQMSKNTWLVGGNGSLYSYNINYTYPTGSGTGRNTNIDLIFLKTNAVCVLSG